MAEDGELCRETEAQATLKLWLEPNSVLKCETGKQLGQDTGADSAD